MTRRLRLTLAQIMILLLVFSSQSNTATAQDTEIIGGASSPEVQSRVTELFGSESPQRVSGGLAQLAANYDLFVNDSSDVSATFAGSMAATSPILSQPVAGDHVNIEATAVDDANALLQDLQAIGLVDGVVYRRKVGGQLPLTAVPRLETIPSLQFAGVNYRRRNVGQVTSEADAVMNVDDARNEYGIDGSGITIGVLSDSYDCFGILGRADDAAADIASGDIPVPTFVADLYDFGTLSDSGMCITEDAGDEGRGMMQLIYDLAPGVNMQFHTAFFGGEPGFAAGIEELVNQGSDVLVDDIKYNFEAYFQDDVIAAAVDDAAASGVPYFSAAGNDDDDSYEAPFRNSGVNFTLPFSSGACSFGATYRLHDFDPGSGVDTRQRFTTTQSDAFFVLQWDEEHDSISNTNGLDSDVALLFFEGGDYIGCISDLPAGDDPIEQVLIFDPITLDMSIGYATNSTRPNRLKIIYLTGGFTNIEYDTNSSTSFGHAIARNGAGVGAAWYLTPNNPEPFTSLGGLTVVFDTNGNVINEQRQQPRFTAIDGTNTTFFPDDPNADVDFDGNPNFFGTSAAAPHAAAVAALMLDCDSSLTPNQVYNVIAATATDITGGNASSGFDFVTGAGLIDANAALDNIADIEVGLRGNGNSIADGDTTPSIADNTDFGNVEVATNEFKQFRIRNDTSNCGYIDLFGGPDFVQISGSHASDFSVANQPDDSNIQFNDANPTFRVRFKPSELGLRTATVTFFTNDPNESVYTFAIQGTGVDTTAPQLVNNDPLIPALDATEVNPNTDLVLEFTEPVVAGNGTISIVANGTAIETIAPNSAQVSINGGTVTINPATLLNFGTTYGIWVTAGTFTDAAGNPFAGLASEE